IVHQPNSPSHGSKKLNDPCDPSSAASDLTVDRQSPDPSSSPLYDTDVADIPTPTPARTWRRGDRLSPTCLEKAPEAATASSTHNGPATDILALRWIAKRPHSQAKQKRWIRLAVLPRPNKTTNKNSRLAYFLTTRPMSYISFKKGGY